ncbi:MAG: hypothetical protein FWE74_06805 [Oscillospiraceae bacterium]|nr:hypothetical protein [Oscillospiraceae bacterium]
MKTKRIFAILLSSIMMLGLTACNSYNGEASVVPETPEASANGGLGGLQDDPRPAEADPVPSADRFDLSLTPDQSGGNGTWWGWISDGTDNVYNGVDASSIQNARYMVIEFNGEADADAMAGLVWQSEADWGWNESSNFKMGEFIVSENLIVMPLYEIMEDFNGFRLGELPQGFIKIILRYGNEKDDAYENYIEKLGITAIYLTNNAPQHTR